MRDSRRIGWIVAVVAALVLVVSACGNEASPDTTAAPGDTTASTSAPAAASVTVTVSPNQGPSGTNATITVNGEANQFVIVAVAQPNGFEYQLSGTSDANGNYTDTGSFTGEVGDVITVTATVGPMQDSPSGSATFTITGVDETTTTSSTTTTTTAPTTTTEVTTTTTTVPAVGFSGGDVSGTIGPGAAQPGQTIHLSACGLQAGENVEWSFLGLIEVGTADSEGCVHLSMTIPGDTPSDAHPMELSGDQGSYAELDYTTL